MTKQTLYEIIGVEPNATQKQIKTAYRELSKSNHPDKMGSESRQSEINHAYEVLSDSVSRARYNNTGQEKDTERNQKVQNFLANIFFGLLNQIEDPTTVNLIEKIDQHIVKMINQSSAGIKEMEKQEKKFKKVESKLKTKGDNNLIILITRQLDELKKHIASEKEHVQFMTDIIEIIKDYSFEFEIPEETNKFSIDKEAEEFMSYFFTSRKR